MINRSMKKNFVWNTLGTGINSFMSFLFLVIVTRINGIGISGVFSVCLSVSFILFTFSNLGNRVYEVSDKINSDNYYYTLKIFACAVSVVFAFVFSLISEYDSKKLLIVMIITVVRCFEALSDTIYAVFQKDERLDLVGISYVLKNVSVLLFFIIVDIITKNILLASLAFLASTVLVYYLFDKNIINKRYGGIRYTRDFSGVFSLLKALSAYILFNLVVMVIGNLPRLISDRNFSDEQMGIFSIIMMIPTVMMLLGQLIIQPLLNGMSNDYSDKRYTTFGKKAVGIMALLGVLTVFCSVFAYFLGPVILSVIMNCNLKEYAFIMAVSIVAGMFNILTSFVSMLLTIMRKTNVQLRFYLITLIAEFALTVAAVSRYGINFVIYAYLFVMIFQFVLFFVYYLLQFKNVKKSNLR